MRIIFFVVSILLFAVLQISFLPNFFSANSSPELVLVAIILMTGIYGIEKIWRMIILAGFFMDIFSFLPIGVNILSFIVTAFVISLLEKRLLDLRGTWKFLIAAFLIVIGTIVNGMVSYTTMTIFDSLNKTGEETTVVFISGIFEKSGYNLLFFALIYWPFEKMKEYMDTGKKLSVVMPANK